MISIPTYFSTMGRAAVLAIAVASTSVIGFAPEPALAHHKRSKAQADLVDTAAKSKVHKTLVAAVQAAGLEETLRGEGPFTVFAPTDDAFAALPEGTVENLLKPENKDQLAAVLTYHVLAGKTLSTDLAGATLSVPTVNGAEVNVDGTEGVKVNNATVVKADIKTSNGIIHVIDTVLLPPVAD